MTTDHIQRLTQANRKLQEQLSEANAEIARLRGISSPPYCAESTRLCECRRFHRDPAECPNERPTTREA